MKRNLALFSLLIGGMLAASIPAYASNGYTCSAPYDLSSKASGFMTKVTGVNLLSEKAAEKILISQIKKNAEGKFKAEVDSFSVSDLTAGRFKGMRIHGENVVSEGVYFSTIDVKTLCGFNYIVYDKKNSTAIFKEDFPLMFGITLSETDLNNTMKAAGYDEMINKVNTFGRALSLFDIDSTAVRIKNNKFYYVFNVKVPMFGTNKPFAIALVSDLNIVNGKIRLENPELMNDYLRVDMGKITKAFNYLNPLEYSLKIMENKDAAIKVQNVKIMNDKINITGIINVEKNRLTQQKD